MNTTKLFVNATVKYLSGFILIAALLFVPAGSLNFIKGWIFIGLLFVPMLILGIFLFIKAPQLLEKRLSAKEKENTQKGVVIFSFLMFVAGFVTAGLDYRFGWSKVPFAVTIISGIVLLLSYGLYARVMKENAYLSRTVEIQNNQKIIDTGLYGIVRHPMYTATILLFLSMPLVLGSWFALILFLPYPFVIAIRIKNEEKVLEAGLPGYCEYKQKVRWRIIPFVW
ncbi:MAG: isoprenylcysteine carboxylmethyltransferase family protein [Spirochaetales bacterium]|nr:isoprenylcysteine carboxylmethyltransferase family protein [Spirochaetales bacterium]